MHSPPRADNTAMRPLAKLLRTLVIIIIIGETLGRVTLTGGGSGREETGRNDDGDSVDSIEATSWHGSAMSRSVSRRQLNCCSISSSSSSASLFVVERCRRRRLPLCRPSSCVVVVCLKGK